MATSSRRGTGGAALGSAGPGSAPVGAARLRSVVVFPAPCSRRSPTCSRREAGWQRGREATALSPVRAAGARPRRGALPFTTKALSGSRAERVRHRRPPRLCPAPPRRPPRPAPGRPPHPVTHFPRRRHRSRAAGACGSAGHCGGGRGGSTERPPPAPRRAVRRGSPAGVTAAAAAGAALAHRGRGAR